MIYIIGVFCQSIVSKGEQRCYQFVAVVLWCTNILYEINIIPSTNCIIFHAVFKNLAAATSQLSYNREIVGGGVGIIVV